MTKCILVLLLISLLSCGEKEKTNELIVSVGPEPKTLDPTKVATVDGGIYNLHIFESLTIRGTNQRAIAGTASSWDKSLDNKSYTFHIRTNAYWSDGEPVTAHDFVYAWRRVVDPTMGASASTHFEIIKNAKAISDGEMPKESLGVRAIDDKTLYVELENPSTYIEELVAHNAFSPLREDIVEADPDGWSVNPKTHIGNGAFVLVDWQHDSRIILEKNTNYWDAKNIIPNRIRFDLISDPNTAIAGIRTGELMFYSLVPPNERKSLLKEGYIKDLDGIGIDYYVINMETPHLSDPRVRKALSLAIDREYIVTTVMQGNHKAGTGFVPENIMDGDIEFRSAGGEFFSPLTKDYEANVKEAQKLMAQAGYPNGEGFPIIELKTDPGPQVIVAESVQNMWKEALGVIMLIATEESSVFAQTRLDGNFQIARNGGVGGYNHPMTFLVRLRTGNVNNEGNYISAAYDNALEESLNAKTKKERSDAMHKAERIAYEDTPLIPIYYYSTSVIENTNLVGVVYDPFSKFRFHYAEVSE